MMLERQLKEDSPIIIIRDQSKTKRKSYRLIMERLWRLLRFITVLAGIVLLGWINSISEAYAQGRGTDILLVIDNSLSMRARDPQLLRVEASRMLVTYLHTKGPEGDVRLGAISFGGEAKLLVPLTPVWRTDEIGQSLKAEELSHTDFVTALRAAQEEFKRSGSFTKGRERIVILLTDGEPWVKTESPEGEEQTLQPISESHFAEIKKLIDSFFIPQQIRLYVLLLGDTPYGVRWEHLAERTGGRLFFITSAEDILPILLQIFTPSVTSVQPTARQAEFYVPPYREYFILTVKKNIAHDTLTLVDPGGHSVDESNSRLRLESSSMWDVIRFAYPQDGIWKLQSDRGDFISWLDIGPLALVPHLETWGTVYPEDMDLNIKVKLAYLGNVIRDPTLIVTGTLGLPDGTQKRLSFPAPDATGLYALSVLPAPLPRGDYRLNLWVTQQAVGYTQSLLRDSTFRVVAVPSITEVALEGPYAVGEPLTVTVRLSREEEIEGGAGLAAEIETPVGKKLPLSLTRKSIGLWQGTISGETLQHEGEYILSAILASGTLRGNVPFAEKRALVRFEIHSAIRKPSTLPSIAEVSLQGSYTAGEPLTVTVQLNLEKEIQGNVHLNAGLETPLGSRTPVNLSREKTGLWQGMIPGEALQQTGEYHLVVTLAPGTLQSNVPFAEKRTVVRFTIHPPPAPPGWQLIPPDQRPVEVWRWNLAIGWTSFLSLLVLILVVIAGLFWARHTRMSRLVLQAERALAQGNVEQARNLYKEAVQTGYRQSTLSNRQLRDWIGKALQGYFTTTQQRALVLDEATYWAKAGELQRQIVAHGFASRWREYPALFLEEARHFYQDVPADLFLFAGLSVLADIASPQKSGGRKSGKDFVLEWLGAKSSAKETWTTGEDKPRLYPSHLQSDQPRLYPSYRLVESPYETALRLAREEDPLTGHRLGCRWIADMRTRMVAAWLRGGVPPRDRDRDHIWVIEIEDLLQERADPVSILSLIYYETRACLRDEHLESLLRDLRLVQERLCRESSTNSWQRAYLVSAALEAMAKARLDNPVPFRLDDLANRYSLSQKDMVILTKPEHAGIYRPILEILTALDGKTWEEIRSELTLWQKRLEYLGLPEGRLMEAILKRWERWLSP